MMKILFVCTHNRCRSILGEAIGRAQVLESGRQDIEFRSAGSQPVGEVHPLTLHYLKQAEIATDGLCSEGWDAHESWAPEMVITVCDSAAGEQCPLWLGSALKVHWGLPDPSRIENTADQEVAFHSVMATLQSRINALLACDLAGLSDSEKQTLLQSLGE